MSEEFIREVDEDLKEVVSNKSSGFGAYVPG